MIWHRCSLKLPSLFGLACCGREATTYDYARKAWLSPEHITERLCEVWLCADCAGITRCR